MVQALFHFELTKESEIDPRHKNSSVSHFLKVYTTNVRNIIKITGRREKVKIQSFESLKPGAKGEK